MDGRRVTSAVDAVWVTTHNHDEVMLPDMSPSSQCVLLFSGHYHMDVWIKAALTHSSLSLRRHVTDITHHLRLLLHVISLMLKYLCLQNEFYRFPPRNWTLFVRLSILNLSEVREAMLFFFLSHDETICMNGIACLFNRAWKLSCLVGLIAWQSCVY